MIKAARLKERNPQLGFGMRTYTTASTGTKYTSGHVGKPSPLRIVADIRELEEIKEIAQFEILEFQSAGDLYEKLQVEMEERSRLGQPAVRAEVISEAGALDGPVSPLVADRKLDDITPGDELQAEDTSDDDDELQAEDTSDDDDELQAEDTSDDDDELQAEDTSDDDEKPQNEDEDPEIDENEDTAKESKHRAKSSKTKKANKGRKAKK